MSAEVVDLGVFSNKTFLFGELLELKSFERLLVDFDSCFKSAGFSKAVASLENKTFCLNIKTKYLIN